MCACVCVFRHLCLCTQSNRSAGGKQNREDRVKDRWMRGRNMRDG